MKKKSTVDAVAMVGVCRNAIQRLHERSNEEAKRAAQIYAADVLFPVSAGQRDVFFKLFSLEYGKAKGYAGALAMVDELLTALSKQEIGYVQCTTET